MTQRAAAALIGTWAMSDMRRFTSKQLDQLRLLLADCGTGKTVVFGPRSTDGMILVGHKNRVFNVVSIIGPDGKKYLPRDLDFPEPRTFYMGAGDRDG